jgi:D-aspartate ligase
LRSRRGKLSLQLIAQELWIRGLVVSVDFEIPVLLATATAGGTIAAVRNLGACGIDVRILNSRTFSAASWSRYISKAYPIAREKSAEKFLKRLLEIGAAEPGQVLLPTSDQTAWLYSSKADALQKYFRIYQPSATTMLRILDKKLLAEAAVDVGLSVLDAWYPQTIEDVEALAPTLPYPILIKPRTQVDRRGNDKGEVAKSSEELIAHFKSFVERDLATSNGLTQDVNVILQKFVGDATQPVHSISGFIDRTGELFVTRHSAKVFQRSRPVGVGMCFESLPTNQLLSEGVIQLCRKLEFFGIFEVEFLWSDDRWNVIDFNPRIFSQIGLDIAQDSPLPLLAYLDAAGKKEALAAIVTKSRESTFSKTVFYDRFTWAALLIAQKLTFRITLGDIEYWRRWRGQYKRTVDFAFDSSDKVPGLIHVVSELFLGLRAVPRFLRSTPKVSRFLVSALAKRRF